MPGNSWTLQFFLTVVLFFFFGLLIPFGPADGGRLVKRMCRHLLSLASHTRSYLSSCSSDKKRHLKKENTYTHTGAAVCDLSGSPSLSMQTAHCSNQTLIAACSSSRRSRALNQAANSNTLAVQANR